VNESSHFGSQGDENGNTVNLEALDTTSHKALSGHASIEELIEEVWDDCRWSKRFSWVSKARTEVLWEVVAGVGCAFAGFLTMSYPHMSVIIGAAVPVAVQVLKLVSAAFLTHSLYNLFHRIFH